MNQLGVTRAFYSKGNEPVWAKREDHVLLTTWNHCVPMVWLQVHMHIFNVLLLASNSDFPQIQEGSSQDLWNDGRGGLYL